MLPAGEDVVVLSQAPAQSRHPYRPPIRTGQILRALAWVLGLAFVIAGELLGSVKVHWLGYAAVAGGLASCGLLWLAAPHLSRLTSLALWLIADTLALNLLVAASGFHESPFYLWLLAPVAAAVVEGYRLVWGAAALGLVCLVAVMLWGHDQGLVTQSWQHWLWQSLNLYGVGALGLDLAAGWLRRKTTRQDLQSQQRYQTFIDGVSDGYYESDLDGRFLFSNEAFAHMLGYPTAKSLLGVHCKQAMSPQTWQVVFDAYNQVFQSGQSIQHLAFQIIRPEGTVRYLEVSIAPVFDERDRIIGFRGTARDVTKRLAAETALAQSEARYRTIYEMSSEGLLLINERGTILDCNQRLAELFGLRREDLLRHHPWDFSPATQPDGSSSREKALRHIQQALQGGLQIFDWSHQRADGRHIQCEVALKALPLETGVRVISASVRDVSELKAMMAKLARSREEYRQLYESARHDEQVLRSLLASTGDPVVIYDSEGLCEFINDAFTRVFGWTSQEMLGKSVDYVPENEKDITNQQMMRIQQGAPVVDFVTRRLTKDGRSLYVSITASAIYDEQGEAANYLLILRDITSRVENERAMRRLYETQKELAQRDSLTGLYNHRRMEEALDHEIGQALATGRPLAVIIMDLDDFKRLNDTHGHLQGDEALRLVGSVLERNCRQGDYVARWGGDEFMLILPGSDHVRAQAVCRRITEDLAARGLDLEDGRRVPISASIGMAVFPLDSAVKERLISRADAAMYLAKASPGHYVLRLAPNSALVSERGVSYDMLLELTALVEERQGTSPRQRELTAHWVRALAEASGLKQKIVAGLERAAHLLEVGKVCLPAEWLGPGAQLEPSQQEQLEMHPLYNLILVRQIADLGLEAQQAVLNYNERWDGQGHPNRLSGQAIPLPGRIAAICRVYAQLCNEPGLDQDSVLQRLETEGKRALDPELVQIFGERCLRGSSASLGGAA